MPRAREESPWGPATRLSATDAPSTGEKLQAETVLLLRDNTRLQRDTEGLV